MRHVLRNVLGIVNIKEVAVCLALPLASGYLATCDAREPWLVVISVPVSVEKHVPRVTVSYVPLSKKAVLIFWR